MHFNARGHAEFAHAIAERIRDGGARAP